MNNYLLTNDNYGKSEIDGESEFDDNESVRTYHDSEFDDEESDKSIMESIRRESVDSNGSVKSDNEPTTGSILGKIQNFFQDLKDISYNFYLICSDTDENSYILDFIFESGFQNDSTYWEDKNIIKEQINKRILNYYNDNIPPNLIGNKRINYMAFNKIYKNEQDILDQHDLKDMDYKGIEIDLLNKFVMFDIQEELFEVSPTIILQNFYVISSKHYHIHSFIYRNLLYGVKIVGKSLIFLFSKEKTLIYKKKSIKNKLLGSNYEKILCSTFIYIIYNKKFPTIIHDTPTTNIDFNNVVPDKSLFFGNDKYLLKIISQPKHLDDYEKFFQILSVSSPVTKPDFEFKDGSTTEDYRENKKVLETVYEDYTKFKLSKNFVYFLFRFGIKKSDKIDSIFTKLPNVTQKDLFESINKSKLDDFTKEFIIEKLNIYDKLPEFIIKFELGIYDSFIKEMVIKYSNEFNNVLNTKFRGSFYFLYPKLYYDQSVGKILRIYSEYKLPLFMLKHYEYIYKYYYFYYFCKQYSKDIYYFFYYILYSNIGSTGFFYENINVRKYLSSKKFNNILDKEYNTNIYIKKCLKKNVTLDIVAIDLDFFKEKFKICYEEYLNNKYSGLPYLINELEKQTGNYIYFGKSYLDIDNFINYVLNRVYHRIGAFEKIYNSYNEKIEIPENIENENTALVESMDDTVGNVFKTRRLIDDFLKLEEKLEFLQNKPQLSGLTQLYKKYIKENSNNNILSMYLEYYLDEDIHFSYFENANEQLSLIPLLDLGLEPDAYELNLEYYIDIVKYLSGITTDFKDHIDYEILNQFKNEYKNIVQVLDKFKEKVEDEKDVGLDIIENSKFPKYKRFLVNIQAIIKFPDIISSAPSFLYRINLKDDKYKSYFGKIRDDYKYSDFYRQEKRDAIPNPTATVVEETTSKNLPLYFHPESVGGKFLCEITGFDSSKTNKYNQKIFIKLARFMEKNYETDYLPTYFFNVRYSHCPLNYLIGKYNRTRNLTGLSFLESVVGSNNTFGGLIEEFEYRNIYQIYMDIFYLFVNKFATTLDSSEDFQKSLHTIFNNGNPPPKNKKISLDNYLSGNFLKEYKNFTGFEIDKYKFKEILGNLKKRVEPNNRKDYGRFSSKDPFSKYNSVLVDKATLKYLKRKLVFGKEWKEKREKYGLFQLALNSNPEEVVAQGVDPDEEDDDDRPGNLKNRSSVRKAKVVSEEELEQDQSGLQVAQEVQEVPVGEVVTGNLPEAPTGEVVTPEKPEEPEERKAVAVFGKRRSKRLKGKRKKRRTRRSKRNVRQKSSRKKRRSVRRRKKRTQRKKRRRSKPSTRKRRTRRVTRRRSADIHMFRFQS